MTTMVHKSVWVLLLCACGAAPQVQVIGQEDPRTNQGGNLGEHAHNDDSLQLPDDEITVEPEHPATQTPQERALTHVHTPIDVCSGILVGPRLVLTAHQCVGNQLKGASVNTDKEHYRVEVASTTLTWTVRNVTHVIAPGCDWTDFDAAILVLDAETPGAAPVKLTSAPSPGASIQALGFGRCRGESRAFGQRTGQIVTREPDAISIDFGLCQGDVGGAIVDTSANLVAIVSHQDDPDNAQRHTTTAFRADAPEVRALLAAGESVVAGGDPAKVEAIACH
jgi:hypothetical protein